MARYVAWLTRWHKLVVIGCIGLVLAVGAGVVRLGVTNDMRAYFSPDNPQLEQFEALEETFVRQDTLYFVVRAKGGDVFSERGVQLVRELTELGWQAPFSRRVESFANFQHTTADADTLTVGSLVPPELALSADARERIRAVALAEPLLVPFLVAPDGSAAGVNVFLSLPDQSQDPNNTVVGWAQSRLPAFRTRFADFDILLGGTTATDVAIGQAVKDDLSSLVVASYLTIAVLLLLALRHVGSVAATIAVVTLSIVATMGLFGWLGAVLAAVAGFVPSVVMTIAVADSVHVFSTFHYEARHGSSKEAAVAEALRTNVAPIFVTSITTIIGVLTLNFSDSPPYRELGNMIAVGVGFAFALSVTFLPALMLWMPLRHPERGARLETAMNGFADYVIGHRRVLLIGMGGLIATLAAFISNNELTERWHRYFDETFEVRAVYDAIDRHHGYLHIIRYALDTGRDQGINDPRYLAEVDRFTRWFAEQPEVAHALGLAQVVKRLNMNLHGDDAAWYRVPETREESAQYLLLYEMSLPQGLGLDSSVDVTRSKTQLLVGVKRTDSEQLLALDERARTWAQRNLSTFDPGEGTGVDMVFAHINHRNIHGLLQGMVIALTLISLMLVCILRSLKLGALSLITNLAPAGLAYGAWGIVHGTIDLSASIVMCMSIGIVVDDTVHFLSKYLRARRVRGLGAVESMRYTFNTVGVALCTTTAVLVAGFAVLGLSHFNPTVVTGTLLATTLAFALVVDLLFMPPLLIWIDGGVPRGNKR